MKTTNRSSQSSPTISDFAGVFAFLTRLTGQRSITKLHTLRMLASLWMALFVLVCSSLSSQAASFTLYWDPSPSTNVSGYRLYQSIGTNPFAYINTYTGTQAAISPPPSTNQMTRWYVTSFDSSQGTPANPNGEGPPSNIWTNNPTVITQPPPSGLPLPPTNLRGIQVTGNRLDLQWDSGLAYSTRIERAPWTGAFSVIGTVYPGTMHYTTTARKNEQWRYQVRSCGTLVCSDPSNTAYWGVQ